MYSNKYEFVETRYFLIPLVLIIHKTVETTNIRFGLEPICFTLANIKCNIQNHDTSWKYLGLVPDFDIVSKKEKRKLKKQLKNKPFLVEY